MYLPNEVSRKAILEPSKDQKKNLWDVCIPANISTTGKWRREYFSNRDTARERASELKCQTLPLRPVRILPRRPCAN